MMRETLDEVNTTRRLESRMNSESNEEKTGETLSAPTATFGYSSGNSFSSPIPDIMRGREKVSAILTDTGRLNDTCRSFQGGVCHFKAESVISRREERICSRSIGEIFTLSEPSRATEIPPVSSLTMTQMASVT